MIVLRNPLLRDAETPPADFRPYFAGPDRPPRLLRDLLETRVQEVPSGGEILWVTYYFRDERLAKALIAARRRGVTVRVVLEENPRTPEVNAKILACLAGVGGILRPITHRFADNWVLLRKGRIHEKLYYFSYPTPRALVGTFNPSGNMPEDAEIIREIGDQDRGHNVLVEIFDPVLVHGLYSHAQRMYRAVYGPWERFLPHNNRIIRSAKTRILFFPRWHRQAFDELFKGLTSDATLRMAVSHLSDPGICKRLFFLSRQGVRIEILAHDTERRVPAWVESSMRERGIDFSRYVHPQGLPMHNKFLLIETPRRKIVTFGSLNFSVRSIHANHELLVVSENLFLYHAFRRRWDEMRLEVQSQKQKGQR